MTRGRHPTPRELAEGALHTLETVLAPELQTDFARAMAIQLGAQLRYLAVRAEHDSLPEQDAEIATVIETLLARHPDLRDAVPETHPTADPSFALRAQAGALLTWAVGAEGPAADAISSELRPVLTRHVEEELGEAHALLRGFIAAGSIGAGPR